MNELLQAQNIHFIGIKGWGMTALAQILQSMGKNITGSDVTEKFLTDKILTDLGIPYQEGFAMGNIPDNIDVVIASAAWGDDNVEIQTAKAKKIPIFTYPQALGLLSQAKKSIGVAGTHGKTTTTALLSLALADLQKDPLAIVGSQVPQFGNVNARSGNGEYFVAETCEYRRHFLNFHPTAIIITNIEEDHVDYFKGLNDIILAFKEYTDRLPANGLIVACSDSPGVKSLLTMIARTDLRIVTYGENKEANYQLINHTVSKDIQSFQVRHGTEYHTFEMQIPGKHNCLNGTAVVAMTLNLFTDADTEQVVASLQHTLKNFDSTTRRLQRLGQYKNVLLYDDFGHHPTEIAVTLKALKDFYPERKLVVSFMPHTYTRTKALLNEFAQAFKDADEVVINEIYASAREKPLPGISGEVLASEVAKHHPHTQFLATADLANYIRSRSDDNLLFLTIGAGDNWKASYSILDLL